MAKGSFTNTFIPTGESRAGTWTTQGTGSAAFRAFIPKPLPPDPPLVLGEELVAKLEAASRALGQLDGIGRLLRGPDELLYSYVRKEAVLSSQIEGTQSSLADLLLHEINAAPGVPIDDVKGVSNYIAALNHGIDLLKSLPLCMRLVREVHRVLVSGTRGDDQTPGEFRTSQNWIGGTMPGTAVFVPPPAHELQAALNSLEKYFHAPSVPTLIKSGLVHAQFETIHPFLDGNGRVGRMLIPLLLVAEGALERPWLYVSLHFKRNRQQYYDLLQRIRTHGEWEQWMLFYLDGVATVAAEAVDKIRELLDLFEIDRKLVETSRGGSIYQQAALQSNLMVYNYMRRHIAIRIPEAAHDCGTTKPTVKRALDELRQIGIAEEVTGRTRGKVFVYKKYLEILNRDAAQQKIAD